MFPKTPLSIPWRENSDTLGSNSESAETDDARKEKVMLYGSVTREERKNGHAVRSYRWWEPGPNKKLVHRQLIVGSVTEFEARILGSEGDRWAENRNQLQKYGTEIHGRCATCGPLPATRTETRQQLEELRDKLCI
jgi:hypothetical protein